MKTFEYLGVKLMTIETFAEKKITSHQFDHQIKQIIPVQ
jgi:hypothetical protein